MNACFCIVQGRRSIPSQQRADHETTQNSQGADSESTAQVLLETTPSSCPGNRWVREDMPYLQCGAKILACVCKDQNGFNSGAFCAPKGTDCPPSTPASTQSPTPPPISRWKVKA